jgi:hypothetical protein
MLILIIRFKEYLYKTAVVAYTFRKMGLKLPNSLCKFGKV